MTRTIVYIDGFNLYYRALKGTQRKWLDLAALSKAVLPASCSISQVNYYTANISERTDPTAPARQHAYLQALGSLPLVRIHYGNFMVKKKWAGRCRPLISGLLSRCRLARCRRSPMSGKRRKKGRT